MLVWDQALRATALRALEVEEAGLEGTGITQGCGSRPAAAWPHGGGGGWASEHEFPQTWYHPEMISGRSFVLCVHLLSLRHQEAGGSC